MADALGRSGLRKLHVFSVKDRIEGGERREEGGGGREEERRKDEKEEEEDKKVAGRGRKEEDEGGKVGERRGGGGGGRGRALGEVRRTRRRIIAPKDAGTDEKEEERGEEEEEEEEEEEKGEEEEEEEDEEEENNGEKSLVHGWIFELRLLMTSTLQIWTISCRLFSLFIDSCSVTIEGSIRPRRLPCVFALTCRAVGLWGAVLERGRGGSVDMAHRPEFVPNVEFENDPKPKHVILKYVEKGQLFVSPSGADPKGNHELRCRLCGHRWVGNQSKATQHFNTVRDHERCPHACVYILRDLQRAGIKLKGSLPVYVREGDREGELEFEHPLNWRLPGVVARQPPLVRACDLAQGRRGDGREERAPPAPAARQDGEGHSAGVGPSRGGGPSAGMGPSGSAGPSSGGGEGAGEGPSGEGTSVTREGVQSTQGRDAYLLGRQSPPVSLVRPDETRYGTNYIMLHRMSRLRESLDGCVSSTAWATSAWLPALRDGARRCFDPQWWHQVELVTTIMGPIHELLQQVDSDGRRVGDVWGLLERLRITVDRLSLDEACHEPIKKIVKERSDMMLTPIHCVAYLLHPKYRSIDLLMRGTMRERILVANALDYIVTQIDGGREGDEIGRVWSSLQDFHGKYPTAAHWGGPVGDAEIEQPDFDPVSWWRFQGGRHPTLRDVAMRCLGEWTTASPCQRNWSMHDFVNTKRRNRLGVGQLEKLVFCHWNLKLLQSSHARGGFIGPGLPGVGLTDVERRAEDYSRYEPDGREPDTYDPEEIEREVDRLRRQSRGRRLARAAVALAQQIQQRGEDTVHGEDVIDDVVSWLSEPCRGDRFLDGEAPPTASPAGRMLPPRAPLRDRGVPARTPACEADSDSLRGDEFPDVSGAVGMDDGGWGDGRPPEADEPREAARPLESDELREAALRPSSTGSVEGAPPPSAAPATDATTQHDTLAAAGQGLPHAPADGGTTSAAPIFSSPHRAVEHDCQGRFIRRPGFTGPLDWWAASTISQDAERDLAAYLPRPLSDLPRVDLDAKAGGVECREPFGAKAAAGEAVATEGGAEREDIARALEGAGYSVEEIEQTLAGYPEGHRHSTHHPGMHTRHGVDCSHARASPLLPLPLPDPSLAPDIAGAGSHSSPVTDAQVTGGQCNGLRDHDSPGTGLRRAVYPMDCGAHSTMPLPPRDPSFIIEPLRPFVGLKRKAVAATGQEGGRSTGRGRARGRPSGEERVVGEGGISAEGRWRGEGRGRGEGRPRGRPPGRGEERDEARLAGAGHQGGRPLRVGEGSMRTWRQSHHLPPRPRRA
ncbi:hypothetical protein CBR_g52078 [Chara braunii]|uniref:HAT C-terminal dimerisation domain-containing protein n=1 Tax=Chara braunii TaxID=69332 RepID=A0A388M9G0_CHABU|nr:hypothetical protein CBR_g52078 [Chara braunii]|eukprot:GBG91196.1 hypothetical protein CBR_g52078 [Chara braunii]